MGDGSTPGTGCSLFDRESVGAPDRDGRSVQWGRIYDVQDLAQRDDEAVKVAAYVAKYAAKTTDGSKELARRFRSRRQIVTLVDDSHLKRLALTAWDLGGEAKYETLRLKEHAHTFGFTGQLITKSRAFSTTFAALRSARTEFMAGERDGDPVEGTFHFEGRGYDDPRGTQLAELFFTFERELRSEARARERAKSEEASLADGLPGQFALDRTGYSDSVDRWKWCQKKLDPVGDAAMTSRRHFGTVRKRSSGRWQVVYRVEGRMYSAGAYQFKADALAASHRSNPTSAAERGSILALAR